MNEIEKAYRKMSAKDRERVLNMYQLIHVRDPNVKSKKLKGFKNLFRVRVGDYRIIYFDDGNEVVLKNIRKRDESTYSDL